MLRLSKMTDYAIVLMARISDSPAERFSAARLSELCGLPEPTVAKLLKALARGHLLVSHRGVQGGYTLSRPAVDIRISDIVTLLEGPVGLTDCAEGTHSSCVLEETCPTKNGWQKISGAVREALDKVTLADMVREHG